MGNGGRGWLRGEWAWLALPTFHPTAPPSRSGVFVVDAESGALSLSQSLDREAEDAFLLTITATDQGAGPNVGTVSHRHRPGGGAHVGRGLSRQ